MASFKAHAAKCPGCRNEYELESITKSVICSRAKRVPAPPRLLERVSEQLSRETANPDTAARPRWKAVVRSPLFKPVVVFAAACIAVILLLSPPGKPDSTESSSIVTSDVIEQSFANYLSVVKGDIRPQLVSDQPDHLQKFFTGKTEFDVIVPMMKECILVGGVLNEFSGVALAHVVYKRHDNVVYVYQACWDEVQKGDRLKIPKYASDELQRTGWYSETHPDGCTAVLWTKGRTLCSAVAHMSKSDLIACLTDGERSGDSPW